MTEQVDLDALEALAKAATPGPWIAGDPRPFMPGAQVKLYGPSWTPIRIEGSSGRHVRPTRDAEFIAATNPSTTLALISELRQERERADEASHAAGRHKSDAAYWENEYETAEDMKAELRAALSRAEETIEAARAAWWSATEQGDNGLIYTDRIEDAMDEIWTAIGHADYNGDKQKGAHRD